MYLHKNPFFAALETLQNSKLDTSVKYCAMIENALFVMNLNESSHVLLWEWVENSTLCIGFVGQVHAVTGNWLKNSNLESENRVKIHITVHPHSHQPLYFLLLNTK